MTRAVRSILYGLILVAIVAATAVGLRAMRARQKQSKAPTAALKAIPGAGPLLAWKLQRLPRRDYDQKAELWPSLLCQVNTGRGLVCPLFDSIPYGCQALWARAEVETNRFFVPAQRFNIVHRVMEFSWGEGNRRSVRRFFVDTVSVQSFPDSNGLHSSPVC